MSTQSVAQKPTHRRLAAAMRIETRSKTVRDAVAAVFKRLPTADREVVTAFVKRIAVRGHWLPMFNGDELLLDTASAQLIDMTGFGTQYPDNDAQILVHLPIFKLFSARARVAIIAHELAHARRAARLGDGWLRKLQMRGASEEIGADRLACRWGFDREITKLRDERRLRVDAHLARIAPRIERRWREELDQVEMNHHA